MDYVSAKIQLGGDPGSVLLRDHTRPVSWPEVILLQFMHGEDSVFDIEYVSTVRSSAQEEKERLLGIYGETAVNIVYPGRRPMMEADFPAGRPEEVKSEPLTQEPERVIKKVGKVYNPAPVRIPAPKSADTMIHRRETVDEEP